MAKQKKDSTRADIAVIKSWLKTGSINIFGLPFSGKDTQGKNLAKDLGAKLLGSGEILRNSQNEEVKRVIHGGHLAPTDKFIQIVTPYLMHSVLDRKPLVLSSVGRWHGEEVHILKATRDSNHPIKAVVLLKIDEQTARQRWQAQDASAGHHRGVRHDDSSEAFDIRFEEFENKTLPVIEFYRSYGLLLEVDGHGSAQEVYERMIQALAARAKKE